MGWRMVHDSEIVSLSVPLQFLAFSDAYLDSAERLCAVLRRSPNKSTYARGSVVLYLTFHAIELFLKAAILEKSPNEQFGRNHDIEALSNRYATLYPGKKYAFEAPFRDETDFTGLEPDIIKELKVTIKTMKRKNPTDLRHRYPRNMERQLWNGAVGFEPWSFLVEIDKLKVDIARLTNLIFSANASFQGTRRKRRSPELPS